MRVAKLHRDKKGFLILLPKFKRIKKSNWSIFKVESDKIIVSLVRRKFRKAKFGSTK